MQEGETCVWALTLEGKRQEHIAANCRDCHAIILQGYIHVFCNWTALDVTNELSRYKKFWHFSIYYIVLCICISYGINVGRWIFRIK